MFLKNSRYFGLPTVTAVDRTGAPVAALKLRSLPSTAGSEATVRAHDRLDAMSEQRYGDATRYWHIADANTELEAASTLLPAGRTVKLPES